MLGTLAAALEVRGIQIGNGIKADVAGTNELVEGVPILTKIHLHYLLEVPAGMREKVDRALAKHQEKCPTALTLRNSVVITWSADIHEV
jgi:uncharacterized OsmC-like protein